MSEQKDDAVGLVCLALSGTPILLVIYPLEIIIFLERNNLIIRQVIFCKIQQIASVDSDKDDLLPALNLW